MAITKILMTSVLIATAAVGSACGGSNSNTTSPTAPSQTFSTDILTGAVPVPVNGVLQSAFNQFVVGQGGGTVSVTMTSAVETLPGGTFLPTITMGLAVGPVTNGTCTTTSGFTTAQGASSPQLSGTLAAGTYCVTVSDVSGQLGPVSYAVAVTHP